MPRMRCATRAGWNCFECIQLLARAGELDRLAGDRAHRKRRATACIAVHAREDHAGERHLLGEVLGDIDRVLTGQAVDDEEDLGRVRDVRDGLHLVHQRLVDMESPGGVEHQHVEALQFRGLERAPGNLDGVCPTTIGSVATSICVPSTASCSCAAGD